MACQCYQTPKTALIPTPYITYACLAREGPLQSRASGFPTTMLRVFKASGEEVLAIGLAELVEMTGAGERPMRALDLKRHLQGFCGQPRFRQKLLLMDGQILSDDAVLNEPVDVQLVLLSFNPYPSDPVRRLCDAARKNDVSEVEQLLQRPQDPNLEFAGMSPLPFAAERGAADAVRLLLEASADMDWAGILRRTPLYVASKNGHVEVVRLLLEAKADKDKLDFAIQGPMYAASETGHLEIVRLLLEAKADKDTANSAGDTPMSIASKHGHTEVVQLLQEASCPNDPALLDAEPSGKRSGS